VHDVEDGAPGGVLLGATAEAEQRDAERVGARSGRVDRVLVGGADDGDDAGARELLDREADCLAVAGCRTISSGVR